MSESPETVLTIAGEFELAAPPLAATPFGHGHIHETWSVTLDPAGSVRRILLQRLNRHVFALTEQTVTNVAALTRHLRRRLSAAGTPDLERRVLQLLPARDTRPFVRTREGEIWRAYAFIEEAAAHLTAPDPPAAYEAAFAFGEFQRLLLDYDGPTLCETIPGFHDTPRRFRAFVAAAAAAPADRLDLARGEIAFARERESLASTLDALLRDGLLPVRLAHNDAKLDNVLLDRSSGRALCVIDLDTVMPGSSLVDFADLVRTGTVSIAEDETDLTQLRIDPSLLAAVARGYLSASRSFLTPNERQHLMTAARVIVFETGLRFLADFLEGDRYFRTVRAGQNLDRCRTQFRLVELLEANDTAYRKLLDDVAGSLPPEGA